MFCSILSKFLELYGKGNDEENDVTLDLKTIKLKGLNKFTKWLKKSFFWS